MKKTVKKSLIFLPGWGFKSSIWEATAKLLNHYDVKTIELPMLDSSHDINKVINTLNNSIPENSFIIAWSLSGLIAIYFCYYLPHKCSKLILVNGLPKFITTPDWIGIHPKIAQRFQKKAKSNLEKLLIQFMNLIQYPGSLHILDTQENYLLLINYLNFMMNTDYRDLFKNLTMPIHCLFGTRDVIVPSQAIPQLAALNHNISVHIFPDAGHMPFLTHQQLFMKLLTGILNE